MNQFKGRIFRRIFPQALNTERNLNKLEDQQMDADTGKDDRKLVVYFDPYGPKATTVQKEEHCNHATTKHSISV